jgi:hypothetical protein
VSQIIDLGASSLIIANILAGTVAEEHYKDGGWCYDNGLELLHHLGGNSFAASDHEIVVEIPEE